MIIYGMEVVISLIKGERDNGEREPPVQKQLNYGKGNYRGEKACVSFSITRGLKPLSTRVKSLPSLSPSLGGNISTKSLSSTHPHVNAFDKKCHFLSIVFSLNHFPHVLCLLLLSLYFGQYSIFDALMSGDGANDSRWRKLDQLIFQKALNT